jgi:hypothetical protein
MIGRVSRAVSLTVAAFCGWLVAPLAGCTSLDAIGPGSGRVCRGAVIGTSDAAFIRRGFCESVTLELAFRPFIPERCRSLPLGDATFEALLTTSDGAFDCAPVRIVGPLEHDLLGRFDFPGEQRLDNKLYAVRRTRGPEDGSVRVCAEGDAERFDADAPCGQDATLYVSFLESGGLEARVLAGAGSSSTGERCGGDAPAHSTGRDLFGVFRLECSP